MSLVHVTTGAASRCSVPKAWANLQRQLIGAGDVRERGCSKSSGAAFGRSRGGCELCLGGGGVGRVRGGSGPGLGQVWGGRGVGPGRVGSGSGAGTLRKWSVFFFTKYMANDVFSGPPRCADSKNPIFHFFLPNFWSGSPPGLGVSLVRIVGGPVN